MRRLLFWGTPELAQRLNSAEFEVLHAQTRAEALEFARKGAALALIDAEQADALSLIDELAALNLPLLALAAAPYQPKLYRRFVERQLFDLVDPATLPYALNKSLVLLDSLRPQVPAADGVLDLAGISGLKNKVLAQLYHQLQGPITALEGYLEILRSDQLSPQSIDQILGQLGHCVLRLRLYFHSLHLLSLISVEAPSLKPRPFQFHQLIREFQRDFQQQMSLSEVAWEYQLDAQNDLVLADPHFLLHLFSVVMSLAQRTGLAKGRTVTLQTNNLSAERLAARSQMELERTQALISFLPQVQPAQYLQVSFQFRGSGPELSRYLLRERNQLPEGFVESDDAEMVLGVYLMEKILQASASWLYVEDQPGFGLLLSFVLPVHSLPLA